MKEIIKPDDHTDNVKKSVDTILGIKTSIKRVKKQSDDHRRILFSKIIDSIIEVEERSIVIDEMLGLDMRKYNKPYFNIFDMLFEYTFNKKQISAINFYMYDRYTEDGIMIPFKNHNGEIFNIETSEQLYDYIKNIK